MRGRDKKIHELQSTYLILPEDYKQGLDVGRQGYKQGVNSFLAFTFRNSATRTKIFCTYSNDGFLFENSINNSLLITSILERKTQMQCTSFEWFS
jgi:hypothetical protein